MIWSNWMTISSMTDQLWITQIKIFPYLFVLIFFFKISTRPLDSTLKTKLILALISWAELRELAELSAMALCQHNWEYQLTSLSLPL